MVQDNQVMESENSWSCDWFFMLQSPCQLPNIFIFFEAKKYFGDDFLTFLMRKGENVSAIKFLISYQNPLHIYI